MTVANVKRIEELVESGVIPESVVQAFIDEWDPIIRVDRSVRPTYPGFVKKVKHPELELAGPVEFDVRKLKSHLHQEQESGPAIGNEIYEELLAKKMLDGCLSLADILAIQARGIGFYRMYFAGKHLPAWASVVLNHDGDLDVPYLCENGDEVELSWGWLDLFCSCNPALCRAS